MPSKIDVALLSNNGILREGLRHILSSNSFNILSASSDADDISFPADPTGDDTARIIIIDDSSPDHCLEVCGALREKYQDARVVVLADRFDFDIVVAAFRKGIDGYLVKEISSEPLIGALRLIAMGEKVLPSELATCMREHSYSTASYAELADVNLSEREIEVLQLLIQGSANKVIGRRLGICEATVKVHVKAALRKLRVENRTQAAIWAVQRGLIGYDNSNVPEPAAEGARTNGAAFRFVHPVAREIVAEHAPAISLAGPVLVR